jgi:hypothetical protein
MASQQAVSLGSDAANDPTLSVDGHFVVLSTLLLPFICG